jgi:putative sterol carrier protein
MPLFASDAEVYEHLGRLIQDAVADDELWAAIARADAVVQLALYEPGAIITVRAVAGGEGEERQTELGPGSLRPDVVLRMSADTLHRLLLGRVNPTVALAHGDVSTRGPAAKVLELVPLAQPLGERYGSQLEAAGREDLARA